MARHFRARSSRFQNPYFPKRARARRWPGRLGFVTAVLAVVVAVYLASSSRLAIGGVAITGARPDTVKTVWPLVQAYLSERVWFRERRSSVLLVNEKALSDVLARSVFVKSISARRSWFPPRVEIAITEREPAIIIDTRDAAYLADERGYIFTVLPDALAQLVARTTLAVHSTTSTEARDLPRSLVSSSTPRLPVLSLVSDDASSTTRFDVRTSPLSQQRQEFLSTVLLLAPDAAQEPIVLVMSEKGSGASMNIKLEQGWVLKVSAARPLAEQLADMREVFHGLNIDRARLDYIDVRYRNRVFYKER